MRRLYFQYLSAYDPCKKRGKGKAKPYAFLTIVFSLLFLLPVTTKATTYFFTGNSGATVTTLANWSTNSSGVGGANPGNFVTTGDVFNIRPSAVASVGATWGIG